MSDPAASAGTVFDVQPIARDTRPVAPTSDSFAPPPTFGELFQASRPGALRTIPEYDEVKLREGYEPIVDALGLGSTQNPFYFSNNDLKRDPVLQETALLPHRTMLDNMVDRPAQEGLIAKAIRDRRLKEPGFAPGVPDTVAGLHDYFEQQQAKKRAAASDVLARGPGGVKQFGATLAGGGFESVIHDPLQLPLLIAGGGAARTVVQAVARDALINGVLAAAALPATAHNMAENDEHLTVGEAVGNVASAAAFGAVVGGTVHVAARVPPALFKVMPESVQRRWADRMKVGYGKGAPLLKDVLGDMDNRELAGFARSTIGDARMTPDEKAAAAVVEREQELGEASPFEPGPVGDAAHNANLADTLKEIADGAQRQAPNAGPLQTSTSPIALRSPVPAGDVHFDTQWSAIKGNEHGVGAHGEFLTSPKGAVGPAQVMPGTAPYAAKLAGLPWDEQRYRTDHAYNEALGRAYYAEQLQTFGDPAMAAAAYNAGPGNAAKGTGLRGAMRRAAEHGEPGNWEAYLPAETQRYVADFRRRSGIAPGEGALGAGEGDDAAIAALRRSADDAEAEAIAASSQRAPLDADAAGDRSSFADVPVLKRDLFPNDEAWADAQAAFHQSLNEPEAPAASADPQAGKSAEIASGEVSGLLPQVVYHGTNRSFENFELRSAMRQDSYGSKFEVEPQAFFFAESADSARMFAEDRALVDERLRGKDRGEPRVTEHRLRVEHPFDFVIDHSALQDMREAGLDNWVDTSSPNPLMAEHLDILAGRGEPQTWDDVQAMLDDPDVVRALRDEGYDGVRLREADGSISWAVFDADQILPADKTPMLPEDRRGNNGGRDGSPDRGAAPDISDAGPIDNAALKAFDDPRGPGAAELADSLEHDYRAALADPERASRTYDIGAAGQERRVTLAELLDEFDRDREAAAALRACAGGGA